MKRVMYVGGSWGNAIYFLNNECNRIYGFKNRKTNAFSEGSVLFDLAHYIKSDYIPLYLIENIKYEEDPRDMFFADVTLIGEVRNPKTVDYDVDWYRNGVKELYETLYSKGWLWRIRNYKIVDTLKLLCEQ